jgi:penicillin-binding protein 2
MQSIEIKDAAHWDVIIDGMVGVTNDPTGTARRSQAGAPYKIAGKTGTAQVFSVGQHEQYKESEVEERLRDHALFVAFAPADAPKLALAVLVENGRSGSGTAAPVARAVFDAYLLPPEQAAKTETAAAAPAAAAAPTGGEE